MAGDAVHRTLVAGPGTRLMFDFAPPVFAPVVLRRLFFCRVVVVDSTAVGVVAVEVVVVGISSLGATVGLVMSGAVKRGVDVVD